MDTLSAFYRGEAARKLGSRHMVFDWDKAAKIISEEQPSIAYAGLRSDWEYTGGVIYQDNKPYFDGYTYLCSNWAMPELQLDDGEKIPCWKYQDESDGWDSSTKWPKSALEILG